MVKTTNNATIRNAAKENGVRLWEVGEKLGLCDSGFSRMMRHEIEGKDLERILTIINEIADEKK